MMELSRMEKGSICGGGVISVSMLHDNIEEGGVWANEMAFVLPDEQYEKYIALKKAGEHKEAKKIFDKFAISQI